MPKRYCLTLEMRFACCIKSLNVLIRCIWTKISLRYKFPCINTPHLDIDGKHAVNMRAFNSVQWKLFTAFNVRSLHMQNACWHLNKKTRCGRVLRAKCTKPHSMLWSLNFLVIWYIFSKCVLLFDEIDIDAVLKVFFHAKIAHKMTKIIILTVNLLRGIWHEFSILLVVLHKLGRKAVTAVVFDAIYFVFLVLFRIFLLGQFFVAFTHWVLQLFLWIGFRSIFVGKFTFVRFPLIFLPFYWICWFLSFFLLFGICILCIECSMFINILGISL